MLYFLQQIANAVPIAALYAALAFGYAIAFAVTRRADLTYGALFAFSGQMFVLFADFGWNKLWLVLPAALGVGAAAGLMLGVGAGLVAGRYVMRPLAFSSANTVVVASLGCLLVLMEMARLASDTRSLWLPPFLNDNIVFWSDPKFPVTLTVIQLLNTLLMVALIAGGTGFWRIVTPADRGEPCRRIVAPPLFAASTPAVSTSWPTGRQLRPRPSAVSWPRPITATWISGPGSPSGSRCCSSRQSAARRRRFAPPWAPQPSVFWKRYGLPTVRPSGGILRSSAF